MRENEGRETLTASITEKASIKSLIVQSYNLMSMTRFNKSKEPLRRENKATNLIDGALNKQFMNVNAIEHGGNLSRNYRNERLSVPNDGECNK